MVIFVLKNGQFSINFSIKSTITKKNKLQKSENRFFCKFFCNEFSLFGDDLENPVSVFKPLIFQPSVQNYSS